MVKFSLLSRDLFVFLKNTHFYPSKETLTVFSIDHLLSIWYPTSFVLRPCFSSVVGGDLMAALKPPGLGFY